MPKSKLPPVSAQPAFHAQDRAHWRAWLQKHHASAERIWLVYFKKSSGKPRLDSPTQWKRRSASAGSTA